MNKTREEGPGPVRVDFRTEPRSYRHWLLRLEPPTAFLTLDVDESSGLAGGYQLKQNSYDLGVDLELYDATQRLRFEHPEVRVVVVESGNERVFCAGANIGMLGSSAHGAKVNFCKFTNETRFAIEDASAFSGQRYLCAVRGTAAGGGYELAMACDHILLADDGSSSVSLPEVPLLAVLPGTGGLTRLIDKRGVRRDLADVFSTLQEGVKGQRALEWKLVDELATRSGFDQAVAERAAEMASTSDRPKKGTGVELRPVEREIVGTTLRYRNLRVDLDTALGAATLTVLGPTTTAPEGSDASIVEQVVEQVVDLGAEFWPLALARELEDALLHLRFNEPSLGLLVLRSEGELDAVMGYDALLAAHRDHWLVREIVLFWKRLLKRFDVSSRSLFALIEPGSCFGGLLFELALAADRSYMFEGEREEDSAEEDSAAAPQVCLSELNLGALPMANGLSRLDTRFLAEPRHLEALGPEVGEELDASRAAELGLVTTILDDIDWDDEIRIALEERASFSPDALTGMEANLRFAGPETMESKIFGRLSAWQNWMFQRPNAVGEEGALGLYGTGRRPSFDRRRV